MSRASRDIVYLFTADVNDLCCLPGPAATQMDFQTPMIRMHNHVPEPGTGPELL